MRFRVCRTGRGNYWFELSERNHGLLITGEPVASEEMAIQEIDWLRQSASAETTYQRTAPPEGGFAYLIRGTNGGILGHSRTYGDWGEREAAIELVRLRAPSAPLTPSGDI